MEDILTRDGDYLTIFQSPVIIDYNLLKWKNAKNNKKSDDEKSIYMTANSSSLNSSINSPILTDPDGLTLEDFIEMDNKNFNIYVGKRITDSIRKRSYLNSVPNLSFTVDSKQPKNKDSKFDKVTKFFRHMFINNEDVKEEVEKINVMDFFGMVKLSCKESATQYVERIKPYMIAMKNAEKMGQQSLVDNLAAEIFNNKYESILYAEGLHHKISEEQIVDFVKKTEKGVRLSYIKNFVRPVPDEILEKKLKADELLVFDNYCVMFYDPDLKSYKLTQKEKEEIRRKKTDPILFGMISGSHNLYYVADWIDEYCDLTLEEFIRVSGIDKQDISIDEKINF